MNSLPNGSRSVGREAEERCAHLDVFREFLDHLGRASRGENDKRPAQKEMNTKR